MSRTSSSWGEKRLSENFQSSDSLLTLDCWKVIQELIQRVSSLKIIDEGISGDPSTREHSVTTMNLWITRDKH